MKTFEVTQDYDPKTFADFIYDFLPEDYSLLLKENQVHGCVAVQADQSDEETAFLLDLAKDNPMIATVGPITTAGINLEIQFVPQNLQTKDKIT